MKILTFDPKIHKAEKIIVYGTEEMGYITCCCLKALNLPIYSSANRFGSYKASFKNVISTDELVEIYKKEDTIILFAVENTARAEAAYLYRKGIEKVYSVRKLWDTVNIDSLNLDIVYKETLDNKERLFFTEDTINNPQKLCLYSLDAMVTERCSLKCKDCSNLMQYYQHAQDMDVNEIKKTIDQLLGKVDHILELRILGGEPFMNTDFVRLIDCYKEEEKITQISVFSNATIMPDHTILEHLKNKKVIMRLSNYGELSRKLGEWVAWCTQNNVRYVVQKIEKWHECGKLERHDYCKEELLSVYAGCVCRNLPTIIGEYLYNCPYAANAANLGAMYADDVDKDRLFISDQTSPDEIERFLYERKYLEACRYCKGRNTKIAQIVPYIQTRTPLTYARLVDSEPVTYMDTVKQDTRTEKCVSIVIPAYNAKKYIERCLNSILNSSYKNLEIIVVDDGSEDGTVEICRKIAALDDARRINVIENDKHEGVVKVRNIGILAAKGSYITFVDADDYIGQDRIAHMAEAMGDCDLVCAGYSLLREDILSEDVLFDKERRGIELRDSQIPMGVYEGRAEIKKFIRHSFLNYMNHNRRETTLWNRLFQTDVLKQICGRVDESIWYAEDLVLTQMYMNYCTKVNVIKNYEYYYNYRDESNRYNFAGDALANIERIYQCLHDEFKTHVDAEFLEQCLYEEYEELLHGLKNIGKRPRNLSGGGRNVYYPFYGRMEGKKAVLYGAGNVGKAYYRHMVDDRECFLVAWIDKNAENIKTAEDLSVEPVEKLLSIEYDCIIIAVYDEPAYRNIQAELLKMGVKEDKIIWNATKYE